MDNILLWFMYEPAHMKSFKSGSPDNYPHHDVTPPVLTSGDTPQLLPSFLQAPSVQPEHALCAVHRSVLGSPVSSHQLLCLMQPRHIVILSSSPGLLQ